MKSVVLAALALLLLSASGCALFRHKKHRQPELPPAVGIQTEFRSRWVNQRVHDLMNAKPAPTEAEARRQAEAEFAKQYPYVKIPAGAAQP